MNTAVRVGGWREMVATLQGREPRNRGTSAIGGSRTLVFV